MEEAQRRLEREMETSGDLALEDRTQGNRNESLEVSAPQLMDRGMSPQGNQVQPAIEGASSSVSAKIPTPVQFSPPPVPDSPAVTRQSATPKTAKPSPVSEPKSVQSKPVQTPISPKSIQDAQTPQPKTNEVSIATPVQPLFSAEQMQALQQPIFPNLHGPARQTPIQAPVQDLPRPAFLEEEQARWKGELDRRDQQLFELQELCKETQLEKFEISQQVMLLVQENKRMKQRMEELEEKQRESDSRFSTPEENLGGRSRFQGTPSLRSEPREAQSVPVPKTPKEAAPFPVPPKAAVQEAAELRQAAPSTPGREEGPALEEPREEEVPDPQPRTISFEGHRDANDFWGAPLPDPQPTSQSTPRQTDGNDIASKSMELMMAMVKTMEKMQSKFTEGREEGGTIRGVEVVRTGVPELPALPTWTPNQGPLQLNDWLLTLEPVIADLTTTSEEWWSKMVKAAEDWYQRHMALAPLDRLAHDPLPPQDLKEDRWQRLERRMSSMMLQAVPPHVKEELVSGRRLTVFGILTHLYLAYCPGGVMEKQTLLRSLEEPSEVTSLAEAPAAIRKWLRWRQRSTEIGASMPDASLLVKGLNRLVRKVLENNKELQFRVSLARNTLGVDVAPTQTSVTHFATHLLAETEQAAMTDKRASAAMAKPDQAKLKAFDAEKGEEGRYKPKEKTGKEKKEDCKFFLTESGCRRGRDCPWSHEMRDEKRRCFACGSPDHMANACTRSKKDSSPKAKISKVEGGGEAEESPTKKTQEKEETEERSPTMKELLEEANRMLKAVASSNASSTSSTTSQEDEEKKDVMNRLHQQLKALRTFQIRKISASETMGLVDSGATHPLRPKRPNEEIKLYPEVVVALANGQSVRLRMSPGGAMVSNDSSTEPIIPMGSLVSKLNCQVNWHGSTVEIIHPEKGPLPTVVAGGCPHLPRALTLQLISELEDLNVGVSLKEVEYKEEVKWMSDLVETHPALKDLPSEVKRKLVVQPGDWNQIPGTRRQRKRWKRNSLVAHLYAGPNEGFTLEKAMSQVGGNSEDLLEIDIKRGGSHDMMADNGVYSGLLCAAIQGKIKAVLGGPNCRTRSVLRHRPIPNCPEAPRPVRFWGGQEFGREDATDQEKAILYEDDVLLWRMVFIYIVAAQMRTARKIPEEVLFLMEQPSSPKEYEPECVSFWDTIQWRVLKKEHDFFQEEVIQSDYGGQAKKPTTFGGNVKLEKDGARRKGEEGIVIKSSKDLTRWPPGVMVMVAKTLKQSLMNESPKLKVISWEDHVAMGHVPYRRDCYTCQMTQQQASPHRRVKNPRGGVLSLDTTGPLVKAYNSGGAVVRWILVGALTWAVPSGIYELRDAEVQQEEELPEEAPEIDENPEPQEPLPIEAGDQQEERPEEEGGEERLQVEAREYQEEERPCVEPEGGKIFIVKTYRLAIAMATKKAKEVSRAAMEMLLKLRADGYFVDEVHSDQGHEFLGYFKQWALQRGIRLTKTAGDNPQQNARAEIAVKCIKTQVRRALHQGGAGPELWPWALRHVAEVNRTYRTGKSVSFPHFLAPVLVRKRRWKRGSFEPTSEEVQYLCPSPEDHGHWIRAPDQAPRLTRCYMSKGKSPVSEDQWLALEEETIEEMVRRRRIRGKAAVRGLKGQESEAEEDVEGAQEREERRQEVQKMIREEMKLMLEDEEESVADEMLILKSIKKEVEELKEEEDVLQTKVVSSKEVVHDWSKWKESVETEVHALLNEKEALKEVTKDQLEEIIRQAASQGKEVEIVPSKLVFTRKAGPKGGKRKTRWVVCGNYESQKEGEQNYSGGADAAACRLLVGMASFHQWVGGTVDVRTAFLNAQMQLSDQEDILVIRPPPLLREKGVVKPMTWYVPLRAVYGFRRSPRLWGNTRDQGLNETEIKIIEGEMEKILTFSQMISEPNLWKIQELCEDTEEKPLRGLLMTYVDDMLLVGESLVVQKAMEAIRNRWSTSEPDEIGEIPVKFLGLEISKKLNEEKGRFEWMITQESYTKDLLNKESKNEKPRKTPITKDQAMEAEKEGEKPSLEEVRQAQKEVGEVLWLVTRSRPDLMFSVSKMSALVLTNPRKVHEIFRQCLGYLEATKEDGLLFSFDPEEVVTIDVYTDASFAPHGGVSHGSFVVKISGAALFWRSGKQHLITLSTAEAEMMEVIEGMVAGESIYVMIDELLPNVIRRIWCDSQSAISILSSEGGSWRTRHLRLRANSARESILRGDGAIQHVKGEKMIADIGTKPLAASRFEMLREMMGMKIQREDEKKEKEQKKEDLKEVQGPKVKKEVLQLVTLAVAISQAKGQEEDDLEGEEHRRDFEILMIVFAVVIVITTLVIQQIWKVGVRHRRAVQDEFQEARSHPGEVEDQGKEKSCSDAPLVKRRPTAMHLQSRDAPQGSGVHLRGSEEAQCSDAPLVTRRPTAMHLHGGDAPQGSGVHPPTQGSDAPLVMRRPTETHLPGGDAPQGRGVHPPSHGSDAPLVTRRPTETHLPGGDAPQGSGEHPSNQHSTPVLNQAPQPEAPLPEGSTDRTPRSSVGEEDEDIEEIWRQIEREEAEIYADMRRNPQHYGLDGEPMTEVTEGLPFDVFLTKYGQVYHCDRQCNYLTASNVTAIHELQWCRTCAEVAFRTRGRPPPGVNLWIQGWGTIVHTSHQCPLAAHSREVRLCSRCFSTL